MERSQVNSPNFEQSIKIPLIVVLMVMVVWGVYNSTKMNSTSFMDNSPSVSFKRVDELNGLRAEGRALANSGKWTPVAPSKKIESIQVAPIASVEVKSAESENKREVLVDGRLDMGLVEVFNPQKYATNISSNDFSGSVSINNDIIDSLSVRIKKANGQFDEIDLSYIEILGKTSFKYELDNEEYSGIIFQSQDEIFVVSFVNGPHAGTRLKFGKEELKKVEVNQEQVVKQQEPNIDGVSFQF